MNNKKRIVNIVGNDARKALVAQSLSYFLEDSIILDFDHGTRIVEYAMKVEDEVVYDILDVLMGICKVEQSIINNEDQRSIISSAYCEKYTPNKKEILRLIEQLENYSTIIMINAINIEGVDTIIFERDIKDIDNLYLIIDSKDRFNKEDYKNFFCLGKLDNIYEEELMEGQRIESDPLNEIILNYVHQKRFQEKGFFRKLFKL